MTLYPIEWYRACVAEGIAQPNRKKETSILENSLGAQQAVGTAQVANDARAQYAQYLEQEPESRLALHRWMKRFQAASIGLVIAVFVKALIVSINWTHTAPLEIAFWWMCFALCGVPLAIFFGLDAIILRAAVFPMRLGAGRRQMVTVTGRQAVVMGLGIILVALAWAGLVLGIAYSTVTFNMGMLQTAISIFSVVIGVGVVISILFSLARDVSRTAAK
jgi:hypothetical protein